VECFRAQIPPVAAMPIESLIERLLCQKQNLRLGLIPVRCNVQYIQLSFTANNVKSHNGFRFLSHVYRPKASIEEMALISIVSEY
jgi:hypothetical protein